MKAVRAHGFGEPDVLRLDDVADPVPGPGEVVIDVAAAGVNPADVYMLTGTYVFKPDLPYTPGGDCAGVVSAIGAGVTRPSVGDRVVVSAALSGALSGCFAEKVMRRAEDVIPLPDNVGFDEAACFGVPHVTAYVALFGKGRARSGETVFVHGASGAVGTAAIQLARQAGLRVIGSAGSPDGMRRISSGGCDVAVDHTAEGYLAGVNAATGGRGPDLILEMLADVNLAADLDLVAPSGRIVIVGCRGPATINPRLAMLKDVDIRGLAIWNTPREQVLDALSHVMDAAVEGAQRPAVAYRFALTDASEGLRAVMRPGTQGKTLLVTG